MEIFGLSFKRVRHTREATAVGNQNQRVDLGNAAVIPSDPEIAYTLGAIHSRLTSLETELHRIRQDLMAQRRSRDRAQEAAELLMTGGNKASQQTYRTGETIQ